MSVAENNKSAQSSDTSKTDKWEELTSLKCPSEDSIRGAFEELLSQESSTEAPGYSTTEGTSGQKYKNRNKSTSRTSTEECEEMVLSIIWQKGQVGAAYYDVVTSELFVVDDMNDASYNFDITKTLYKQCQPHSVVTVTGLSGKFLDVMKKLVVQEGTSQTDDSDSSRDYRTTRTALKLMTSREHSYDSCCCRVKCLKLESEPKNAGLAERVTYLNSLLNFKSRAMIYALGLLLRYLDKNWNAIALERVGQPRFVQLHHVTLHDVVMLDDDTYKALQIVQPRHHPSFFKFGNVNSNQEGVSLFNILNRCQSRPGVRHLLKILRHPTTDIEKLNERFNVIEFFLDPNNQSVVENLILYSRNVQFLTTMILNRLSAPQAKASDWRSLHKTIRHVICIADVCARYRDRSPLFAKISESITDEMHNAKYFIGYMVDFDANQQDKFVVKPGVDPELDDLRYRWSTLPQLLTTMGQRDMKDLPSWVTGCRMLYFPDIRYVLGITEWSGSPPEDLEIPGLEFKFMVNGIRHYKSAGARELDDTVGDIFLKITNRQCQVLLKLVRYVSKHIGPMMNAIRYCSELDAMLSLSTVARDYNYVRPKMVTDRILALKRGRHPLQELYTTFVPNDTFSGCGGSNVKILTGPIACGKSIYLKQVALIVFMAHIGCYVPAESATIGIVTHIFSRIHSAESIELNASSFLIDLRQMSRALSGSTPHSLVIIDEFGKGTSEIDGLALLAAALKNFIDRGADCPHIFATTHLHGVLEFLPETTLVENQTFDYVTNDDGSLAFLYTLISGNVTCSFAHTVAKSMGLNPQIVERALTGPMAKGGNQQSNQCQFLLYPLDPSIVDRILKSLCSPWATSVVHRSERLCEYLFTAKTNIDTNDVKSKMKEVIPDVPSSSSRT